MSLIWLPLLAPPAVLLPLAAVAAKMLRTAALAPAARVVTLHVILVLGWLLALLAALLLAKHLGFEFGARGVPFKLPFYLASLVVLFGLAPRMSRTLADSSIDRAGQRRRCRDRVVELI